MMTMTRIILKKVTRLHLQALEFHSLHSGNQYHAGGNADTVNLWLKGLRANAVDQENVSQQVYVLENCLWIQKYYDCAFKIAQILGMTVKIPVHLLSAKLLTDNLSWKSMVD